MLLLQLPGIPNSSHLVLWPYQVDILLLVPTHSGKRVSRLNWEWTSRDFFKCHCTVHIQQIVTYIMWSARRVLASTFVPFEGGPLLRLSKGRHFTSGRPPRRDTNFRILQSVLHELASKLLADVYRGITSWGSSNWSFLTNRIVPTVSPRSYSLLVAFSISSPKSPPTCTDQS